MRNLTLSSVLSTLASIVLLSGPALAQDAQVFIEPPIQTVATGSTATVTVRVNTGGLALSSCQVRILYGNTPLTFNLGASTTNSVAWDFFRTMNQPAPDDIAIAVVANSTVTDSNALIATLQFTVTATVGTSQLNLLTITDLPGLGTMCLDSGSNPVTTTVVDGAVVVAALTATPSNTPIIYTPTRTPTSTPTQTRTRTITGTPTHTRTPTPTVPHVPCAGDCDADGVVEGPEQVTCTNVFAGTQNLSECPACDADGDGEVFVTDLTTITRNIGLGCQAQIQQGWAVNPSNDGQPAIAYNELICQSLLTKPCLRLPILATAPAAPVEGNVWVEERDGGVRWCVQWAGSPYCTALTPS